MFWYAANVPQASPAELLIAQRGAWIQLQKYLRTAGLSVPLPSLWKQQTMQATFKQKHMIFVPLKIISTIVCANKSRFLAPQNAGTIWENSKEKKKKRAISVAWVPKNERSFKEQILSTNSLFWRSLMGEFRRNKKGGGKNWNSWILNKHFFYAHSCKHKKCDHFTQKKSEVFWHKIKIEHRETNFILWN